MKCDNAIIVKDAKMKGSGKPYKKVVRYFNWFMKTRWDKSILDVEIKKILASNGHSLEDPCGGNIIATVKAVDELEWGGTSASLEVEYKCDRCGCDSYQELPDEYRLSEFITEKIAEISEDELLEMRIAVK